MKLYVSIETPEQFEAVCNCETVSRIYVDGRNQNFPYAEKGRQAGKEVFLAMPYVFRRKAREAWEGKWGKEAEDFDGILVRNYESFSYLKERGYKKAVVTDHNLYIFNREAEAFWGKNGIQAMTAPLELNWRELKQLELNRCEIVGYGYLPMMISAGCVQKNTSRCTGKSGTLFIKDRYQKQFMVKNDCDYCYNVIYNTLPLSLADQQEELRSLAPQALRLIFTVEDAAKTEAVLDAFGQSQKDSKWIGQAEFTRGHFKRGIK